MSDIIRLLPDSVANQIAAGEVIQRPSSIVKELVENAVDAGATEITLNIVDAGKTMVQVIDNGRGMSETDARMAFERHATSKIRQASDLFTLQTMGFRGEALPSICAISEVDVKTRTDESTIGTHLIISASRVETQEPCMCDRGTVISVKKVFFNIPARRKFLKSDNVEMSNIMREFERMALVNNRIRMRLNSSTRQVDLRPGTFRQRIGDLWKNNLDEHLIPVEVDTSLIKIEGFVSPPQCARRRNFLQYLIVNGRNMRHPYFHKAILSCYENLIASDTQPNYFLKFTVNPDTIDVNISPTKNEIKFENEQMIRPILVAAVKAALGKNSAVPSIDFSMETLPVEPLSEGDVPETPGLDIPSDYNPFEIVDFSPSHDHDTERSGGFPSAGEGRKGGGRRQDFGQDWTRLYENFNRDGGETDYYDIKETDIPEREDNGCGMLFGKEKDESVATVCMQFELKYIVTATHGGLMIIDQYRAHEKILYERFLKQIRGSGIVSQTIMFPEVIELDSVQQSTLSNVSGRLARLGFQLEYDDEERWRIMSAPNVLRSSDHKDIVYKILELSAEEGMSYGGDEPDEDTIYSTMALAMAKSSSIKRGTRLSGIEMEHLIGELFSLPEHLYTPDGNLIYTILDDRRLQGLFMRN